MQLKRLGQPENRGAKLGGEHEATKAIGIVWKGGGSDNPRDEVSQRGWDRQRG